MLNYLVAGFLLILSVFLLFAGEKWPKVRCYVDRFDKIGGTLSLFIAIGLLIWQPFSSSIEDRAIDYQVRVQSNFTEEEISGADIRIEVSGRSPFRGVSNSEGLTTLSIPSSYAGETGTLIVVAPNYERKIVDIVFSIDGQPLVIQLEPSS